MSKTKTIFRIAKNADNPYVMIDKRLLENPELSWRAKGILAYLLSRPDNWVLRFGDLVNRSSEGSYIVRKSVRELRQAGYIHMKLTRKDGHIEEWIYEVYELPFCPDPSLHRDFQHLEDLHVEDRDVNNKDLTKKDLKKNEEEEALAAIAKAYESEIGIITTMVADDLRDASTTFPVKWVLDAIHQAALRNARNWSYVSAILKRWKQQGNQESMKPRAAGGKKSNYDENMAILERFAERHSNV